MIPVANIYYLLCYAWDVLDEMDRSRVDPDSFDMLPDLLGFCGLYTTIGLLRWALLPTRR